MSFERAQSQRRPRARDLVHEASQARGSQLSYATFAILMGPNEPEAAQRDAKPPALYCPQCAREV